MDAVNYRDHIRYRPTPKESFYFFWSQLPFVTLNYIQSSKLCDIVKWYYNTPIYHPPHQNINEIREKTKNNFAFNCVYWPFFCDRVLILPAKLIWLKVRLSYIKECFLRMATWNVYTGGFLWETFSNQRIVLSLTTQPTVDAVNFLDFFL